MQLGWLPNMVIHQTSDTEYGQIYVPVVNWIMMVATVSITIGFGSSARLTGAFGTAVATTMMLTTLLLYDVMRERWHWRLITALPVVAFFLLIDITFFCANLLKILDGGFVPLLFGALLFTIMVTWHRGVVLLKAGLKPETHQEGELLALLENETMPRTDGSAVFLSRRAVRMPPLISRHITVYGALPAHIVTLYIKFEPVARVPMQERLKVENCPPSGLMRQI